MDRFEDAERWPARTWLLPLIGMAAGLLFHWLTDRQYPEPVSASRQAGAALVMVSALSFILVAERRRIGWAAAFALGWGLVIALVGWFTARYNVDGTIFEGPFLSAIAAVLVAAPLFQTLRDEGRRALPYARLHNHAWTDAVIGAASLAFTGLSFLLAFLIAQLFDTIGIDLLKQALGEEWFGWMLAGAAFGVAAAILRERDALVATLQKLVMVVLAVLAPVLAVSLLLFLASLPFQGLARLWASGVPATPLLLTASAGAVLLANAVIGNKAEDRGAEDRGAEDRSTSRIQRWSAIALIAVVLPLAVLAGISLSQRIGQYGWTPERIWGVVAVLVALSYGVAGWWALALGREQGFDERLRPLQTRLAVGLCGLTLLLALPILDFGAISTRSQLARFEQGLPVTQFDWMAMARDFGPAGRRALSRLAEQGPGPARFYARQALVAEDRYGGPNFDQANAEAALAQTTRLMPPLTWTPELRSAISRLTPCRSNRCVVLPSSATRILVAYQSRADRPVSVTTLARTPKGEWAEAYDIPRGATQDLAKSRVEVRTVPRRQLFVDGQPVGPAVE